MFEDKPSVQAELTNVRILQFGTDEQGDTITAEGATVPNEVVVMSETSPVGRATLRVKNDGIYGDIALTKGSIDGRIPMVILVAHEIEKADKDHRTIKRYEITGVGLTTNPVRVIVPEVEDEPQNSEQVPENK